jgi:hypothetical protein
MWHKLVMLGSQQLQILIIRLRLHLRCSLMFSWHMMDVMAIGYMIYYIVKLLTWDFLSLEHICYASKTTRTFPVSDLIKEYLKLLNRLYDITWFGSVYA